MATKNLYEKVGVTVEITSEEIKALLIEKYGDAHYDSDVDFNFNCGYFSSATISYTIIKPTTAESV